MISLNNFISIKENEDLYFHLVAEYYQFNIAEDIICEYHGIPTDFETIAKYCVTKIAKHNENKFELEVDLSNIKNINPIVNSIKFLVIKDSSINVAEGEYKNNIIELVINTKIDKYDLCGAILHELIHLYRDKQYKQIGSSLIKRLYKDSYSKYSSFIGTEDDEDHLKQILYKTNNEEICSFTAETKIKIEKEKPKTPSQAISIIANDDNYKFYKGLINLIDDNNLLNVFPNIKELYNSIFNTNYSEDKIINLLNKGLYKAYHKFMKQSSKYCCDCLNIGKDKLAEKEALKKLNKKLYN